ISAFARAGAALGDRAYVARAEAAARFALDGLGAGGTLRRADTSPVGGFLDDHALLAAGLLDLWDATFDPRWLREALHLQRVLARDFWDDASGGFFTTAARAEAPLAREKRVVDDPLPAGNAVAVDNLLRLAELTGDDAHRRRADATLRALGRDLARSPTDAARLLAALERRLDRAKEIVIVAPAGRPETAAPLLAVVRRTWLPNAVLAVQTEGPALDAVRALVPLLEGKRALDGRATAYVCEERVCAHPTTEPDVLAAALAPAAPLP
ncbi:MAG TPA: thioredoxin domain-containing protein, partial [Candidatus Binatia bacterium]|nr:thioredoxin domain-containing protein [Candidatus Binatia bacterium]